jgi:hypothetical protein
MQNESSHLWRRLPVGLDRCPRDTLGRPMTRQDLEQRVTRAAEAALAEQRFVSAIDVLLGLGWLAPSHLDQWRQGRS